MISNNNGTSSFPSIAGLDSKLFIVWQDNTAGNGEIYFTSSNDSGKTFGEPINISNNNNGTSSFPVVDVS